MLWRTLSIIENVEGLSVVNFYEKYTPTVQQMPPLSLSTYWDELSRFAEVRGGKSSNRSKCLVGIPGANKSDEDGSELKRADGPLMSIPELEYLRNVHQIDLKHDPLSIVQNIYGAAASIVSHASPYNRSILLSACAAFAIKSGRASLMLNLISTLSTLPASMDDQDDDRFVSVDLDPLRDLCAHVELAAGDGSVATRGSNNEGNNITTRAITVRDHYDDPLGVSLDPLVDTTAMIGKRSAATAAGSATSACKKGVMLSFGKADHGTICEIATSSHHITLFV